MQMADASESKVARREYKGSCHCGFIKYFVVLELPLIIPENPSRLVVDIDPTSVRVRKCNCSVCHKIGFFHMRLPFAPKDFSLLSPLDPLTELGNYTVFRQRIRWLFCKTCAVRCFAFMGEGAVIDREIDGEVKKVWAPKEEGWKDRVEEGNYLSVNAQTLEPGQEGLNLLEWHEKGQILYLDELDEKEGDRLGKPHRGGTY
jgi:hypothetical protein